MVAKPLRVLAGAADVPVAWLTWPQTVAKLTASRAVSLAPCLLWIQALRNEGANPKARGKHLMLAKRESAQPVSRLV